MISKPGGLLYQDAHLTVNPDDASVTLNGRQLPLTRKELLLLVMLVRHANQVVPREMLLTTVWEYQTGVKSRTLDVHVRRLRKHFGAFGNVYIETIFGQGYRFQTRSETRSGDLDGPPSLPLRYCMAEDSVSNVV